MKNIWTVSSEYWVRSLPIVATLAIAYVASHFFRASNVTIGLDLMRDLHIGPEALGALTGAFFFGFSAMQIPCGFFFDRFGPRRTVSGMLLLAVAGAALFTLAPSWPVLLTGRAMMGAGFGVMLIGSMVVISRWFPPDRFSTLAGIVLSIGLVGNLLATTPLAWGTELIGWRGVFGLMVAFTAIAALAVWLIVRDAPPGHPFLERTAESPAEMLRGLAEVLRNPQLPYILTLNFCNYACTFTVQGLWGWPFLREVHGLSRIESGNVLLGAVIAYQIGMLVFGPLDRLLPGQLQFVERAFRNRSLTRGILRKLDFAVVDLDADLLAFVVHQVHPAAHHFTDLGNLRLHLYGLTDVIRGLGQQRGERYGLFQGERLTELEVGGGEEGGRKQKGADQSHENIMRYRGARGYGRPGRKPALSGTPGSLR